MSLPEHGARVAGGVVDALKSQPVVLALVVFNVLYLVGTFYVQIKAAEYYAHQIATWERMAEKAMAYCPQKSAAP